MTRRRCLQMLALAAAPGVLTRRAQAAPKPTDAESGAIASIADAFMKKYGVPGLSVAFAKAGELVYAQGFGMAETEKGEKVTPAHRFRIASVSKPLTSVAIHTLIEQGKLNLQDKVFGEQGLLGKRIEAASAQVADISLHHLLTHTGGGWSNTVGDPMFQNPEMNHAELIDWTLRERALEHAPGEHYAYSNFGYCVLGRVIEKLTGMSYADYVKKSVLAPSGVDDMQIAGNALAERATNEVVYYGQSGQLPYRPNVRRMDSHGGWIATPTALVKIFTHVDGDATVPDLLRPQTLRSMLTPTVASGSYACGFSVNKVPNWWHGGSLPGTLTIAVRTASGMSWAGFANTRAEGMNVDRLMWEMAKAVPAWKA